MKFKYFFTLAAATSLTFLSACDDGKAGSCCGSKMNKEMNKCCASDDMNQCGSYGCSSYNSRPQTNTNTNTAETAVKGATTKTQPAPANKAATSSSTTTSQRTTTPSTQPQNM
jgi:hypothetical protein